MKIKLTLIALIGILLLSNAQVKAQSDTTTITKSHLQTAEKLIATTGMTDVRFSLMRNEMVKSIGNTVPIPENNKGKFILQLTAFMDKYLPIDAFKNNFIRLYAQNFSEVELNQLISFYNSPLGKKVIAKLPELMQRGMAMEQQALKDHYSEIESIANESMKE